MQNTTAHLSKPPLPSSPEEVPATALLTRALGALKQLDRRVMDGVRIERLVVGLHYVGVKLSTGRGGVAFLPPDMVVQGTCRQLKESPVQLKGLPVHCLAEPGLDHSLAHVLRLACLNALSAPFLEDSHWLLEPVQEEQVLNRIFRRKRVCMIGAMTPLIQRIHTSVEELLVIDRKEDTPLELPEIRLVSPGLSDWALNRCQTAILTGATLSAGSLEEYLGLVPEGRTLTLMGPSAGLVPQPFFERGVALVGTGIITDPDHALDILAEGGGSVALSRSCTRWVHLFNPRFLEQLPKSSAPAKGNRHAS
nr:DUF364 domain-containing protein [uncultured Holophaga sp.]